MVIFHGIDLVDSRRIEQLLQRHGERFLMRVFTAAEQAYCQRHRDSAERFAGRFAVKEAVMKALGTGWQNGIAWTDVETVNVRAGAPEVHLRGKLAQRAKQLGAEQIRASITHSANLALASVVAFGTQEE